MQDENPLGNIPIMEQEPIWKIRIRTVADQFPGGMRGLSIAAGMSETWVRDVLHRGSSPKSSSLQRIAQATNRPVSWFLGEGPEEFDPGGPFKTGRAQVIGQVQAGAWLDDGEWDRSDATVIPTFSGPFESVPQYAYRVVGDSMDLEGLTEGGYVVTVTYEAARGFVRSGDLVLVERHDDGRMERTVKRLEIGPQGYTLTARSSNPKYKPLFIPKAKDREIVANEIRVVGLVIGYYRPLLRG